MPSYPFTNILELSPDRRDEIAKPSAKDPSKGGRRGTAASQPVKILKRLTLRGAYAHVRIPKANFQKPFATDQSEFLRKTARTAGDH